MKGLAGIHLGLGTAKSLPKNRHGRTALRAIRRHIYFDDVAVALISQLPEHLPGARPFHFQGEILRDREGRGKQMHAGFRVQFPDAAAGAQFDRTFAHFPVRRRFAFRHVAEILIEDGSLSGDELDFRGLEFGLAAGGCAWRGRGCRLCRFLSGGGSGRSGGRTRHNTPQTGVVRGMHDEHNHRTGPEFHSRALRCNLDRGGRPCGVRRLTHGIPETPAQHPSQFSDFIAARRFRLHEHRMDRSPLIIHSRLALGVRNALHIRRERDIDAAAVVKGVN